MNRVRVLTMLTTMAVVPVASQWGFAESITLISSGGGMYDYALDVPPFQVSFNPDATVTLSGLSGVTGALAAFTLTFCLVVPLLRPQWYLHKHSSLIQHAAFSLVHPEL